MTAQNPISQRPCKDLAQMKTKEGIQEACAWILCVEMLIKQSDYTVMSKLATVSED